MQKIKFKNLATYSKCVSHTSWAVAVSTIGAFSISARF